MGGERGPRVLSNWRAFAALSDEEMNEGEGWRHLPAPTRSLGTPTGLSFLQPPRAAPSDTSHGCCWAPCPGPCLCFQERVGAVVSVGCPGTGCSRCAGSRRCLCLQVLLGQPRAPAPCPPPRALLAGWALPLPGCVAGDARHNSCLPQRAGSRRSTDVVKKSEQTF